MTGSQPLKFWRKKSPRKKSRSLLMVSGGIYSSKSGIVYFIIGKNVFMKGSRQYINLIGAREEANVKTKEHKPTSY